MLSLFFCHLKDIFYEIIKFDCKYNAQKLHFKIVNFGKILFYLNFLIKSGQTQKLIYLEFQTHKSTSQKSA